MGKYDDIYARARIIGDPVWRARYINRAIQIRYFGFWRWAWMCALDRLGVDYEIR